MVYMAGDNSLSTAGEADLDEMRRVGSSDDVNVLVLYDSFGPQGAERSRIEKDSKNERIQTLKEMDSGDPKNLVAFVDWAVNHYPAERYGLVLWSHGNGWQPADVKQIAKQVNAAQFNTGERAVTDMRRILFRPTLEAILALPSPGERAICIDDASGHSLDTAELGQALQSITKRLGQPLEILGMDACLMSSFEVAYQARACARYLVASEDLAPESGWAYESILTKLVNEPNINGRTLARHIVRTCTARGKMALKSLTALDLAQAGAVASDLGTLAQLLAGTMKTARPRVWEALQHTTSFMQFTLWDIAELCNQLSKRTWPDEIATAIQRVAHWFEPNTRDSSDSPSFVIAHASTDKRLATCGGISIYIPAPVEIDLSRYYAKIEFAQQTAWASFLQRFKQDLIDT